MGVKQPPLPRTSPDNRDHIMTHHEFTTLTRCGPFAWRWPEGPPEKFREGLEGQLLSQGRTFRFRLGFGSREVFGRVREHLVVWLDGEVMVEATGEDDCDTSACAVSLLKRGDGKSVRERSEMPAGYENLEVLDFRAAINAPYARNALALRARLDDASAWARHALIRFFQKRKRESRVRPPDRGNRRVAEAIGGGQADIDGLVVALLRLSSSELKRDEEGLPLFTDDRGANQLVARDPFAFLVAVICDQGIRAEQAWAIPYRLRQRLGHLDPFKLQSSQREVLAAVGQSPKLHRYVNKMSDWIVAAAAKVVADYGGDASRIWSGRPSVTRVHERFEEFKGVGQKKSSMAVEILERDLKVPIRNLHESQLAYDIHIRRVALRTGLAEHDDITSIQAAAIKAYPKRPGALDYPMWVVGRTWCDRTKPNCAICRIRPFCAQRIGPGTDVHGQ
jgi:uncharacterized HhH-GPD family protein